MKESQKWHDLAICLIFETNIPSVVGTRHTHNKHRRFGDYMLSNLTSQKSSHRGNENLGTSVAPSRGSGGPLRELTHSYASVGSGSGSAYHAMGPGFESRLGIKK